MAPLQGRNEMHERFREQFMVGKWWGVSDLNTRPKDYE